MYVWLKQLNKPRLVLILSIMFSTLLLGRLVFNSSLFNNFLMWSKENPFKYFISLTLIKVVSLVYPPLPGGLFTIGSIPIIGWFNAFIADTVGSVIGGIINYNLAKKFGPHFIKFVMGGRAIKGLRKIQINKNREVESLLVTRVLFGGIVTELIHYAAGIFNVKFSNYLLSTLLFHTMYSLPLFFLVGTILETKSIVLTTLGIGSVFIGLPFINKFRERYIVIDSVN